MRTRPLALLLAATMTAVIVPAAARRGHGEPAAGAGSRPRPVSPPSSSPSTAPTRDYLLSIPDSYDPSTRSPLIFDFHGLGSNKEQQALYTGMNQKAGAAGYVVVTPDGTGTVLRHWAFPPLPGAATDVDFVKAMLATTARTLCIDPKRVYATGMSNGAIFSTRLACALPGRFAAIAPVAGVNATKVCAAARRPRRCSRSTAPPIRSCRTPAVGTSRAPIRSTTRRSVPAV